MGKELKYLIIHSTNTREGKDMKRINGIQSLYSPGTTFNDYRITTDTTGIKFDKAGIILRFKRTRNTSAREFLFTIRGTANNNNEIDCYTRTTNGKVYVKVYNGTSEQALEIPNLVVNEWNTLVESMYPLIRGNIVQEEIFDRVIKLKDSMPSAKQ